MECSLRAGRSVASGTFKTLDRTPSRTALHARSRPAIERCGGGGCSLAGWRPEGDAPRHDNCAGAGLE
eukprot:8389774-Lingulodinium_polyedra.AAC.1